MVYIRIVRIKLKTKALLIPASHLSKMRHLPLGITIIQAVVSRSIKHIGTFKSNPLYTASAIGEVEKAMAKGYRTGVTGTLSRALRRRLKQILAIAR
jgi:hypothetical protein